MKKIPLWKNIALIAAVFVMLVIATFAWFYNGPKASANDILVKVGDARYLQIFDPNNPEDPLWNNNLVVKIDGANNFKEISGDGVELFTPNYTTDYETVAVEPEDKEGETPSVSETPKTKLALRTKLVSFDNIRNFDDPSVWASAPADGKLPQSKYFYQEVLNFRADNNDPVLLTSESFVTAVGEARIDAALRIGFFELDEDGNETLRLIWAPNSNVRYDKNTGSFYNSNTAEAFYAYQRSDKLSDVIKIATNQKLRGVADLESRVPLGEGETAPKFMWSDEIAIEGRDEMGQNLPENAPSIFTWGKADENGIFYKNVKVKIWLEGHDEECVSQLIGQKFRIMLKFTIAPGGDNNE